MNTVSHRPENGATPVEIKRHHYLNWILLDIIGVRCRIRPASAPDFATSPVDRKPILTVGLGPNLQTFRPSPGIAPRNLQNAGAGVDRVEAML
jgi:hypothetical protein